MGKAGDDLRGCELMRIFLICSVRGVPPALEQAQIDYVSHLENEGHSVYFPPRHTNQDASGLEICRQNFNAILACDEVHVFYRQESQGTHFDMGMAFALNKPVRIAYVYATTPA